MADVLVTLLGRDALRNRHHHNPSRLGQDDAHFGPCPQAMVSSRMYCGQWVDLPETVPPDITTNHPNLRDLTRLRHMAAIGSALSAALILPHLPSGSRRASSTLDRFSARNALSRVIILPKADNDNRGGNPTLAACDLPRRCLSMRRTIAPS